MVLNSNIIWAAQIGSSVCHSVLVWRMVDLIRALGSESSGRDLTVPLRLVLLLKKPWRISI
jgi:hypothetical protein